MNLQEAEAQGLGRAPTPQDNDAEEIMDDVMTRGRGEIKRRSFQDGSQAFSGEV